MTATPQSPDIGQLVELFYGTAGDLGQLTEVAPGQLPIAYERLLFHDEHMTVSVEAHYESLVDVEVLAAKKDVTHYARKILLHCQRDNKVVQFGIMRVALACLDDSVRAEIEAQACPLGRILIRHNVLRTVHLDRLWKVEPGADLCRLFGLSESCTTYGRTAGIHLDGEPAVEVFEILAPLAE